MHIYSHSELSCERASKSYIASPKHLITFLETNQLKGKMKPEKPLFPAQASTAALSRSHRPGSRVHSKSVPALTSQVTQRELEQSFICNLEGESERLVQ